METPFPRARVPTKNRGESSTSWKSLINRVLSEIGICACCLRRRSRDRANIAAARRTLRQNPNSSCRWDAVTNTLCALIAMEKIKTEISSIFNYVMPQLNEA